MIIIIKPSSVMSESEAAVDFEPLIEKAIADTEMVIASNERVKAEGKA